MSAGRTVMGTDCCAPPIDADDALRASHIEAHACCHWPANHCGASAAHAADPPWVTWICRCGSIDVRAGRGIAVTCDGCGERLRPDPHRAQSGNLN